MQENNIDKTASICDEYKSTIKNIFDNLKNLNTCALIFVVGIVIIKNPNILPFIESQYTVGLGWLDIFLAFLLLCINSIVFFRFINDSHSKVYQYLSLVPQDISSKQKSKLDRTKFLFISLWMLIYFLVVISIVFVGIYLDLPANS